MQKKYRFKSEERDRKFASILLLLIALVFLGMAICEFAASYIQYELGNALETQVNFVAGLVLFGICLSFVAVVKIAAHQASKCIILDENDPNDVYTRPPNPDKGEFGDWGG